MAWDDAARASENLERECASDPMAIVDGAAADWATKLAAHLDGWRGAARHLRDWCARRGTVQQAAAEGLGALLGAMEDGLVAPSEASRVFEVNYARWWIGLAVEGSDRLKGFVAARHERQIERFRELDTLASAIPAAGLRERDPEYGVLAHDIAKWQRHLPVRQMAARMPTAMRRLAPCLVMSPLSVAQFLPADAPSFDLVVFDEASQIATWDAIGVIGRGRQVVVVGDPKQLPPTRFFERLAPGMDADGMVEVEDLESILDECLGAGIPSVALRWHYRSRSESLIAFSNHMYYGGGLVLSRRRIPAIRRSRTATFRTGFTPGPVRAPITPRPAPWSPSWWGRYALSWPVGRRPPSASSPSTPSSSLWS